MRNKVNKKAFAMFMVVSMIAGNVSVTTVHAQETSGQEESTAVISNNNIGGTDSQQGATSQLIPVPQPVPSQPTPVPAPGTQPVPAPGTQVPEQDTDSTVNPGTGNTTGGIVIGGSTSSVDEETKLRYTMDNEGVTIRGYEGEGTEIVIPEEIDGISVTAIGNSAFQGRSDLTSVTIPESVKSIGVWSFAGCSRLTSITIPKVVTSLVYCFPGCSSLTSIKIPEGVTTIGDMTFDGCSSLEDITIPESVREFGDYAFRGTPWLENQTADWVVVNNILIRYKGTESEITFPDEVTGMAGGAFAQNETIVKVTIPAKVTNVPDFTFSKCTALENVIFEEGVTSIGFDVFDCCSNLISIQIPVTVTSIGDYAIGYDSFKKAEKLPTIYCEEGSAAYNYAVENEIPYKGISEWPFEQNGNKEENEVNCKHTWDEGTVKIKATCTTVGEKTYQCSICEKTKTEEVEALGHIYAAEWSTDKEATCAKAGSKSHHCTREGCDAKSDVTELPLVAHTFIWITDKVATTETDGSIVSRCVTCGEVDSTEAIYYPRTVSLSKTVYTYNGKALKPTVEVEDSNGEEIDASNYTVEYTNNKSVGQAKVTITFKGDYSGTITKTFTINPKKTSISKVTAKSKGVSVKWKKQTKETTGYEIQYSTSMKFKGAKSLTIKKNKTVSTTVKRLKSKKKYYVRIRTYKTVDGKKYYSEWSSAQKVTTKK